MSEIEDGRCRTGQTVVEQIGRCRFPMAQTMPRIQNLVDVFLTAPGDRKCLRGSEKAAACR